jgi:hypothetical protein
MSSGGDSRRDGRTTWTLGAIKQRNLALEGYCQTGAAGISMRSMSTISSPPPGRTTRFLSRVLCAGSAVVI